ncbi:MAG: T9SS type A sorting domain-containing protein [Bacteroidota bacterium]
MKHRILLFCLFIGITAAHAQITSTIYPPDGTDLQLIGCDAVDPLAEVTGPNAVWDYSGLTGCNEDAWICTFHDAEGNPEAENFPDANKYYEIEIPPSTNIKIFSNISDSDWSIYGVKYNDLYVYCDGESILQFPGELDQNWISPNIWSSAFDSISNESVYTIDGIGTLILPNATYENVFRVHSMREEASGLFTEETYTYYSPNYQFHLFHMLVDDESQYQLDPKKVKVSSNERTAFKEMIVAPNPVSGNMGVGITLDVASKSEIVLFSNSGERLITVKDAIFNNGYYFLSFDQPLNHGLYLLQVLAKDKTYTSRLVIQ